MGLRAGSEGLTSTGLAIAAGIRAGRGGLLSTKAGKPPIGDEEAELQESSTGKEAPATGEFVLLICSERAEANRLVQLTRDLVALLLFSELLTVEGGPARLGPCTRRY